MKWLGIICALVLSSSITHAQEFRYNCKSWGYLWTAIVTLDQQRLIVYDHEGSDKKGILVYENRGLKGGRGSMKDNLEYVLSREKSTATIYSTGGRTYYVPPYMLTGGKYIKGGVIGGYFFTDWEDQDYLKCVLEK